MSNRLQFSIYFAVALALIGLTSFVLSTESEESHLALDMFANALAHIPFRKIETTIYVAAGSLFLYPLILRPVVVFAYRSLPTYLRFIPRKFVEAANFRMFLLSLVFASFSGIFFGLALHGALQRKQTLITPDIILGTICLIVGVVFINMQKQFAEIRAGLKKREFFEAVMLMTLTVFGFLIFGFAFIR